MNNTFCVLPFFGAEYQPDSKIHCCLLPINVDIVQVRQDLLSGVKTNACTKCWQLEDQGKISDRLLKNSAYDYYTNKDIKFVEEECRQNIFSEQIVKIETSNLCNSTCMTCTPQASTAWATLRKMPSQYSSLPNEMLESIDYQNLKMLTFVGGEPLYDRKNFQILENLANIGNTNCFISITTNGSVNLTNDQISTLEKFNNLNFCLSIDGVGAVFEYVRYPLKWQTLLENIKLYRKLNIQLSVSYTISNLNVLYYQETIDWFNSQNLPYNHNVVTFPAYFKPSSLPLEIKEQIEFGNLASTHSDVDDLNFKRFIEEVKLQDAMKKISVDNYLPKVADIINQRI